MKLTKEYVLAAGDQIEVAVRRTPEVSRTVGIRPDGKISLPLAGEIQAAGRTPAELSADLKTVLATRLIDPEVTVIATNTRQPSVYVVGELNTNAVAVPLRSANTALQAISQAGGFRRSAAQRDVAVIRLNPEGYLQATVIEADRDKGQPTPYLALASFPLEPDDVLFVPESTRSQWVRAVDDFVNRPLSSLNLVFQPFLAIRYIQAINP
jgi:protein involved in polysaccharide export with SLBB domain